MFFCNRKDKCDVMGIFSKPMSLSTHKMHSRNIRQTTVWFTPILSETKTEVSIAIIMGAEKRPPHWSFTGHSCAICSRLVEPLRSYAAIAICSAPCHVAMYRLMYVKTYTINAALRIHKQGPNAL